MAGNIHCNVVRCRASIESEVYDVRVRSLLQSSAWHVCVAQVQLQC